MELEQAAAEGVAARARGHVDDAAGEAAELGAAAVGLDAEFLDRVGTRRQHHDVAVGGVLHRHAVEERRALVGRAAANLVVAGREDVLAGQTAVGAPLRHHRRRQRDEVEHVAAVQRHLLHGTGGDGRGDRRALRLQQRGLAGDRQRLREVAEGQRDVDAGRGLDVDRDALAHPALEPRELRFDAIRAGHQVGEARAAILGADRFASFASGLIDDDDSDAWQDAALVVFDHRQHRSVETLGHHRGGPEQHSG